MFALKFEAHGSINYMTKYELLVALFFPEVIKVRSSKKRENLHLFIAMTLHTIIS